MNAITRIFTRGEKWLAEHIGRQLDQHGFLCADAAGDDAHSAQVQAIAKAMKRTIEHCQVNECVFPVADDETDPIKVLASELVCEQRGCKRSLPEFVKLLSLVRDAHQAILETDHADDIDRESATVFVTRFFDRLEMAGCMAWARADQEAAGQKEVALRKAQLEERERFLALFESMLMPVIVLDSEWGVEAINSAAVDLLENTGVSGELEYAQVKGGEQFADEPVEKVTLSDAFPWLDDAMSATCTPGEVLEDCRFSAVGHLADGEHQFDVAVSAVQAESIDFSGMTLVLSDVTFRAQMERRLSEERNRANHYLDVAGSIIVVLDPSGMILRINKAGCDTLGYEESELLGRNWIDVVIPEEFRDEMKDYFYVLSMETGDYEQTHVNHVVTKSGEKRLVNWNNQILKNDNEMAIGILSSGLDVTEQKAMEERLAEKELWLRNTFVALGEAVLILSPDGEVIDANPAAEPMFGMTNTELSGLDIRQLQVDDVHYEDFKAHIQAAVKLGETAEFEFPLRRQNGEIFPAEQSLSRITDDNGVLLGSVFALRDISRRKKAEQVLRASEEKFRRIFETIGEGFIVVDLDGIIQMVNPATCKLLGYEADELVNKNMSMLYADASERGKLRQQLVETGRVQNMILSAARKDGSVIAVEGNAHLVRDEDGTPMLMEGTFRDITSRIEAEKVLREREKQYRAFFENNHAIMLLEDPRTGQIVDANPAASEFYGYSVKTMRTMNMHQIHAHDEEALYQEMFRARDEQRTYFVLKHRLADGDERDVEVYSGPILVGGKQLLYSVIHDVTKRIQLEREMKRMATTDALTGAANRHQFFRRARREFGRFQRYGGTLATIMFDIDHFKSINDTYGHQAGDAVLKGLAAQVMQTLRESDEFGRIGGEEFVALLAETSLNSALQVAERLREELAHLVVEDQGRDIRFTVSMGVTAATSDDKTIEEVINRADGALYRAKRMGRNRVEKG